MHNIVPGILSLAVLAGAVISGAGAAGGSPAATATLVATQTGNAAAPKSDPVRGKTLNAKYGCWQCHGYEGQGGAGPRLAPDPMPFDTFAEFVRQPPSQMPPYTDKVLVDQDLRDIHAFLASIPKPPDPSAIPLLKDLLAPRK